MNAIEIIYLILAGFISGYALACAKESSRKRRIQAIKSVADGWPQPWDGDSDFDPSSVYMDKYGIMQSALTSPPFNSDCKEWVDKLAEKDAVNFFSAK